MAQLIFMGGEYESVPALGRDFPAFTGEDAVRAIRAGCTTVLDVEVFCWRWRNKAYRRQRAAAQRSRYSAAASRARKRQAVSP